MRMHLSVMHPDIQEVHLKAVILAGGRSTRLRPLTWELPKPMVPVANIPVMDIILDLLKQHGITDICATLMFMPQKIQDAYGNGSRHNIHLTYNTEERPLGTAGSVRAVRNFADETFLVISGDCVTDFDLSAAFAFHREQKAEATILMTHVDVPIDYGVLITDPAGNITGFQEKPQWGEVFTNQVNTGIYILEPSVLEMIPQDQPYDFARDLFPEMLRQGRKLCGFNTAGYWSDIGTLDAYARTHFDILQGRMRMKMPGTEVLPGIFTGPNTQIDPTATLRAPLLIGANCRIGPGVLLDGMCVIGDNTVLEEDVSISRSILWNGCYLDYAAEIRGSVLANRVHLMHHTLVSENTVIGDETIVREHASLRANVLVWPRKVVDPHATVDASVIFTERRSNMLFGKAGLSGIINVDLTPEFASRLGAAYGTRLGARRAATVSWDGSPPALLFRYAFISGLLSTGVKVYEMEAGFLPVARQSIPLTGVAGGVHIMRDNDSTERLQILFLGASGANVTKDMEKDIESLYAKEEFIHTTAAGISDVEDMPNATQSYARHLMNLCDLNLFRTQRPRIVLASAGENLISFLTGMFTEIGCEVADALVMDHFTPYLLMQETNLQDVTLSAWFDRNASTVLLMDRNGHVIQEDAHRLLTSMILFRSKPGINLLLPVSTPSAAEKLARRHDGAITWVRTDENNLLHRLMEQDVFSDAYNQYQLQFDAIASLLFILEFLLRNHLSLENALRHIPPFYTETRTIHCPWEMVGRVMHRLIHDPAAGTMDTTDGVKFIMDGGWVLVLPDGEQPMLRLFAEGLDARMTHELMKHHVAKIEWIIDTQP